MKNSSLKISKSLILRLSRRGQSTLLIFIALPLLTIGAILPQGLDESNYFKIFDGFAAGLITNLGWDNLFHSLWYFLPAASFFFFIFCLLMVFLADAVARKSVSLGIGAKIVLLIGILFFLISGPFSSLYRDEFSIVLAKDESYEVYNEFSILLKDASIQNIDDHSTLKSILELKSSEGAKKLVLEYGKPLSFQSRKLYQSHWSAEQQIILKSSEDKRLILYPGEGWVSPEGLFYEYQGSEQGKFVFVVFEKDRQNRIELNLEDELLQGMKISGEEIQFLSGITLKQDPGELFFYIGLLMVGVGILALVWNEFKSTKMFLLTLSIFLIFILLSAYPAFYSMKSVSSVLATSILHMSQIMGFASVLLLLTGLILYLLSRQQPILIGFDLGVYSGITILLSLVAAITGLVLQSIWADAFSGHFWRWQAYEVLWLAYFASLGGFFLNRERNSFIWLLTGLLAVFAAIGVQWTYLSSLNI